MIILMGRVAVGKEMKVAQDLAKLDEVSAVYLLTGEYDFLAEINIKDVEAGMDFVLEKVRKIGGITETRTMFAKKVK
ncbi:MAG: Lrp/AsnC ligand binding domain-containing protein [Candidatus Freyarchaeota archaeon]|nr:Lrp/AsnC ligand binding domain-containing protein [Candidatus Jordarchaeia archaeon]MBS7278488.1 Lrp/AsnC ligand binding domain-containing protein [Candidatus Jordarchaeia archaeon]